MKDVIENNKLIAEFMMFETVGDLHLIPFDNTDNDTYLPEHMKFHSSWDWLMPVVDKIEDFFTIGGNELEFQVVTYEDEIKVIAKHPHKAWETLVEVSADGSGKKENTYKAVVEFIKWYNENK